MPLYDYSCDDGHITERLMPVAAVVTECFTCGKQATRQAVYPFAFNNLPRAQDFVWPSNIKAMHDEAMGTKHEALAAKAEAEANGFRG